MKPNDNLRRSNPGGKFNHWVLHELREAYDNQKFCNRGGVGICSCSGRLVAELKFASAANKRFR